MSADKLEEVREALAEVFNGSNRNATSTETSHPAFDHKALSKAFSEPHLNVANTEQSFAREHAALAGMFGEPSAGKPPTSFDQTFANLLSGRSPPTSDTRPRPGFDHEGFAEIFSAPSAVSTNTKPLQPSFDHQALAEMLTEPHADPINPPTSPLSFDAEPSSSSAPFSGQIEHGEPVANAPTAPPPTNADDPRPPRAKSLLAKLHHIFSTKEEPVFSGQLKTPEPMSESASTPADHTLRQQANSMLTELSPPSIEQEPASPRLTSHSGNVRATEDVVAAFATDSASTLSPLAELPSLISKVAVSPSPLATEPSHPILFGQSDFAAAATDAKSAGAQEIPFSVELPPLNPIDSKIDPTIRQETSAPTLTGQPDNVASAVELASARPTDIEPARPQQAEAYLVEAPHLISTNTEPSLSNPQGQSSPPSLSGRLRNTASTLSTVTPIPPTNTVGAPQQRLSWLLAGLAPMVSADPKPPLAASEQERSTSLTGMMTLKSESVENTASVAPLTGSESAVMPSPRAKQVLGAPTLHSTDTEPQPLIFESDSSPIFDSGQPVPVERAAVIVAAAPLSEAEQAQRKQGGPLLADLPPSGSFFEKEPSPAIFSGDGDKIGLAGEATPPTRAATAPQPESSPLGGLPSPALTEPKSALASFEQDLPSASLSGQPDGSGPPLNPVEAAGEAESARPQPISALLTALRVLTAKPSPPISEKENSRSILAGQPDSAAMSAESVADPTHAESTLAQQAKSLPSEKPASLVSTDATLPAPMFEKQRSPVSDQQAKAEPRAKAAAVALSTDTENAETRAQQAKALLHGLDLNTAIHLRWVMRDIQSKRTKFSPVSADDLTTLLELGLVEIREELPRLTGLGLLALD